ncbi:MAG: hypothetical protein R3341_10140 [Methylophaga sp.]|nr:hypothetical protein [Methylophaga sp.]
MKTGSLFVQSACLSLSKTILNTNMAAPGKAINNKLALHSGIAPICLQSKVIVVNVIRQQEDTLTIKKGCALHAAVDDFVGHGDGR